MSSIPISATHSSHRILLVEDDPSAAELMRRTLERSAISVEIAAESRPE